MTTSSFTILIRGLVTAMLLVCNLVIAEEYIVLADNTPLASGVTFIQPDTSFTHSLATTGSICGIASDSRGKWLYLTHSSSGEVTVIDAIRWTQYASYKVGGIPCGVAVHKNGEAWVTDQAGSRVIVLSPNGVQYDIMHSSLKAPADIAFSPDGDFAYVVDLATHILTAIEVSSGQLLATTPAGQMPFSLAVDADSGTIYTASTVIIGSGLGLRSYEFDKVAVGFNLLDRAQTLDPGDITFHNASDKVYASIAGNVDVFDISLNPLNRIILSGAFHIAASPTRDSVYVSDIHTNQVLEIETINDTVLNVWHSGNEQTGTLGVLSQKAARMLVSPDPLVIPVPQYNSWSPPVILTITNASQLESLMVYQVLEGVPLGKEKLKINASKCEYSVLHPQISCQVEVSCKLPEPPSGSSSLPGLSFIHVSSDALNSYESVKVECVPG